MARILAQLTSYTNGKDISWHNVLLLVPTHNAVTRRRITTFAICQKLVDALPIHSFQKIEGGKWRERLINVAVCDNSEVSGGNRGCIVVLASTQPRMPPMPFPWRRPSHRHRSNETRRGRHSERMMRGQECGAMRG
jgi:hypothetical protein